MTGGHVLRWMGRHRWLAAAAVILLLVPAGLPLGVLALTHADLKTIDHEIAIGIVMDDDANVFRAAARFAKRDAAREVIVYDPAPRRAERIGAIRRPADRYRDELLSLGVTDRQIVVRPTDAMTPNQWFRRTHQWLQHAAAPTRGLDSDVVVFCSRIRSKHWRHVIDQSIGSDAGNRFKIYPLGEPNLRPMTWFRSRYGGKVVASAWLRYLFVRIIGEGEVRSDDRYEILFESEVH